MSFTYDAGLVTQKWPAAHGRAHTAGLYAADRCGRGIAPFAVILLPRMPLLPAYSEANLIQCAPMSCVGFASSSRRERGKDKLIRAARTEMVPSRADTLR